MIRFLCWGYNTSAPGTLWRNGRPTDLAITALLTVFGCGVAVYDRVEPDGDCDHYTGARGITFGRLIFEPAPLVAEFPRRQWRALLQQCNPFRRRMKFGWYIPRRRWFGGVR